MNRCSEVAPRFPPGRRSHPSRPKNGSQGQTPETLGELIQQLAHLVRADVRKLDGGGTGRGPTMEMLQGVLQKTDPPTVVPEGLSHARCYLVDVGGPL